MAPRSRHSHASLMVILSILLFAGIGVFVAQTVAQKQSLDAGSRAGEERLKPRFSPTPSPSPTPLPTGKPEILGVSTEREAAQINNSSRTTYVFASSNSSILRNSILFIVSGLVVLIVIGFLISSKALLM